MGNIREILLHPLIVGKFANIMHESWRKSIDVGYSQNGYATIPFLRSSVTGEAVDINKPFHLIPERYQQVDLRFAMIIDAAIQRCSGDVEAAMELIHNERCQIDFLEDYHGIPSAYYYDLVPSDHEFYRSCVLVFMSLVSAQAEENIG